MGRFSSLRQFAQNRAQQTRESNSLNSIIKMKQLEDSGYSVTPKSNFFGTGYDIKQNDTVQTKEGFVRFGGKTHRDPSYMTPLEQEERRAKIKAYEALAQQRSNPFGSLFDSDESSASPSLSRPQPTRFGLPRSSSDNDFNDPMELEAQEAIARGADPVVVRQRLAQMRARQQ